MVLPILTLTLLLVGCPKRPGVSPMAAPAPTGGPAAARSPGGPPASAGSGPLSPTQRPPTPSAVSTTSKPPSPKEFRPVAALKNIHFDFDQYAIRPDDARILDEDARWMKANPRDLILVEGHCDERGTNEDNLALGERRARAAMNYLVGQGVQASRITTISYGEERPVCTGHDEACWSRNRRAHFLVKAE